MTSAASARRERKSTWTTALMPVAGQITAMGEFLRAEIAAGRAYLPAGDKIPRAFGAPVGPTSPAAAPGSAVAGCRGAGA